MALSVTLLQRHYKYSSKLPYFSDFVSLVRVCVHGALCMYYGMHIIEYMYVSQYQYMYFACSLLHS